MAPRVFERSRPHTCRAAIENRSRSGVVMVGRDQQQIDPVLSGEGRIDPARQPSHGFPCDPRPCLEDQQARPVKFDLRDGCGRLGRLPAITCFRPVPRGRREQQLQLLVLSARRCFHTDGPHRAAACDTWSAACPRVTYLLVRKLVCCMAQWPREAISQGKIPSSPAIARPRQRGERRLSAPFWKPPRGLSPNGVSTN